MPTREPTDPLHFYRKKRNFSLTIEPSGAPVPESRPVEGARFVVQKHAASRLHYDFRLELGGVLVSWAVPKGPSLDPADKRMAIHVEDHPLAYADFEGTIPPKQYGAGTVIVWDRGRWAPQGDPGEALARGKLVFELHGQKLKGLWELVKIAKPGDRQEPWILFKKRDHFARPRAEFDVISALPDSVVSAPIAPPNAEAEPASEAEAEEAELPIRMPPQLATLASGAPPVGRWLYEIKFDGYRLLCRIERGQARLLTRGGHDWSKKMPGLVAELEALGLDSAWLDGEIVVLDSAGLPNFNALQKSFERAASAQPIDYFLFDAPYLEGRDLRRLPLARRRAALESILGRGAGTHLRLSQGFTEEPNSLLHSACRMGLEGVIAKHLDSPYFNGRTDTWLKFKCRQRQEFVICGYTDRSDGSAQVGSLILGVHEPSGQWVSVGSVGTGWSSAEAASLKKKLTKLETAAPPFERVPKTGPRKRRPANTERWVEPKLVAEVEFAETTPDGQVRHATYLGLRDDKAADEVRRERARATESPAASSSVKVSHGDRVIDKSTGLTKLDLVRYYESVAEFMLPHLKGRPCSLVRGPNGVEGALFFQKHGEHTAMPGVRNLDPALWPGHDSLIAIDDARGLASAAQMNMIEVHTWNATERKIDLPDRMIFDLDPGEGTSWQQVQEAASLVRGFLDELGLASWLKTSGGKGLHVVVPLSPRLPHDTVKEFSHAVVRHLAKVVPARFVDKSGPANRVGKVFVDYLRNSHGATTASAFSARARPGLGVSMPVAWDALPTIKSGAQWNIADAREHLSFQKEDPWAGYWKQRQTLTAAMKALGFKPGPGPSS